MPTNNPIAISAGHGSKIRGASGYLDEVDEARRVCTRVTEILRSAGVTVHGPFFDDISTSQNENLNRIVSWHNQQDRMLDLSIHFNAYQTTSEAMGTETLYVTQAQLASEVAAAVAAASDLPNRGGKKRTDLFFLNNTSAPALLEEVVFVDSSTDAEHYNRTFDEICTAIASTISGITAPVPGPEPEPPEPTDTPVVTVTVDPPGSAKVVVIGAADVLSE
jgi:N-acetylmuramoyl-L-alanine amidase